MSFVGCNNTIKPKNQIEVEDSIKTNERDGRTTGVINFSHFSDKDF